MPLKSRILEIDSQAWSVFMALRDVDLPEHTESFAIYNGRERWIGLEVPRKDGYTYIIFGEHRNSDDLCVQSWVKDHMYFNPPTVADIPDESYTQRVRFDYMAVGSAIKEIRRILQAHK